MSVFVKTECKMESRKTSSAFGFLVITKIHSVLLHVVVENENY